MRVFLIGKRGGGPDGSEWYFEIVRGGTFPSGLRLMSVAVEY
ncbi:MAG: hypothetical protein ACREPE_13875 [Lysobacter sp.]